MLPRVNETLEKLMIVGALAGLAAGAIGLSRSQQSAHSVPQALKTSKPAPEVTSAAAPVAPISSTAVSAAPAPAPVGTPLDRVVDWELAPTGCSRHQFGESLAVFGDTLLVGAPWRDYAVDKRDPDQVPAACLYHRDDVGWSLTQRLVAKDPPTAEGFARAVALGDAFAVVGAAGHESGDGPTHDYTRSAAKASLRTLLEEPSGNDEVFDEYGAAVASDARMVLVGAHLHREPDCDACGGVFVFHRSGPKQPELLKGDVPGENLGTAVAIGGDLVVVGAAAYYSNASLPGAAIVYRYEGDRFRRICRLVGSAAGEEYGASVATDGTHVVVGAYGKGHASAGKPRFTLHEVKGDSCVAKSEFSSAGASVAIGGSWVAAGEPWFDGGAIASGRVALFHLNADGTLEHRAWILPKTVITRGWFGLAVAISDHELIAGAPGLLQDGSAFVAGAKL